MAEAYKTPGVYVEEISKLPPSVAGVETAIPAFIGYTQTAKEAVEKDLVKKAKRITSMPDYRRFFGFPQPETKIGVNVTAAADGTPILKASLNDTDRSKHIMYYALEMYFGNGGGPCYIVSAGLYKEPIGTPLDKGELSDALDVLRKEDEPTLIAIPEAQNLNIADYIELLDAALGQCADLQDRFVIMDVHGDDVSLTTPDGTPHQVLNAVGKFRDKIGPNNLKYGAAYAPNIETSLDFAYEETTTNVTAPALGGNPAVNATLDTLNTSNNRLYALAKAAISGLPCKLPPSAAIAGIYAAVDKARGVWKAPANVGILNVIQPTLQLTNLDQDDMNVDSTGGKSVNAIRSFIGRGTLVWGARTLAGNDNEWRYVNVRRFTTFVETSVRRASQQFVFEPNDANTWVKLQGMIENFLTTLWRQGALQGVKPEDAFYVAVGLGKTMTALDILEGRMIVEVGMAAVRPAEFIILRFSQKMATS